MTIPADAVMQEARADIRAAIHAALEKIKTQTGIQPTGMSIYVDIISTGPQWGKDPDYLLGEVDVEFCV